MIPTSQLHFLANENAELVLLSELTGIRYTVPWSEGVQISIDPSLDFDYSIDKGQSRSSSTLSFFPNSQVFQELNNFSGVMQVLSCIESAAINRLQHTFAVSRRNCD